jgi:diguanylate cyclase (GGDEF)-like protein
VALLPDTTFNRAVDLADRLRRILEDHDIRIPDGRAIRKTASFGVASYRKGWCAERFVNEADRLLYRSKILGRNRVMPKPDEITPESHGKSVYNLGDLTPCAMT